MQNLAEYYGSADRYAEAAGLLKDAVARFPDSPGVLFQYGAMLERQSLHAEAEKVFRQVLARNPEHGPTLNYLGYTLIERGGRLDEAVALLKRAVALDPYNGAYLDSLGWAYLKTNQLDLAEPNLRTAAAQLPRDSVVQDHWGDLLAKRGKHADAVEAWRRALAGDGDQIDRAAIERKISDALEQARQALTHDPAPRTAPRARAWRGRLRDLGDHPSARRSVGAGPSGRRSLRVGRRPAAGACAR